MDGKDGKSNDLLTITEAAKALGVSKITLRNWDKTGNLTAVRLGSRGDRRYRKSDIETFLLKATTPTPSREIDNENFEKFLQTNTFWTEEIPGLPCTLERGIQEMVEIDSYFPAGFSHCLFLFEEGYVKQFLSVEESITTCKEHMRSLITAPEKVQKFIDDCKNAFTVFDTAITFHRFLDLSALSNDELNAQFSAFDKALTAFWKPTLVVEPYSPYLDHEYVPAFTKRIGDKQIAEEAFPILSIPTELSFVSEERRDMLEIITIFLSSPEERERLMNSSNAQYLTHLTFDIPELLSALTKHTDDYFWIKNSYAYWTVLTLHNFVDFMREVVTHQSIEETRRELRTLKSQQALRRDQEEYAERLSLPEETRKELEYLRTVVWIKDERKKHVVKMLHVLFSYAHEYAKRSQISFNLVAHATAAEMPKLLAKDISESVLAAREVRSFWISQHHQKFSIITGNEALTLKAKLSEPHKQDPNASIQGTIACRGEESFIRGKVKVILNPKNETIEKDEILVTSMTRPEFVSLMRKARAVITDEGGITSHAAIVSREMNKPCVIGTKNATKLLTTGDTIEMKMNHGLIKILT